MSRLLAFVAYSFVRGLRRAVTTQMTDFTAVVALLSLGAISGHVSKATAGVARSLALATAITTSSTTTVSSVATTAVAAGAVLGALACYVSDLATFITLLAASTAASAAHAHAAGRGFVGTVTRNVTILAAAVARLLGLGCSALATQVTLLSTVVACRVALRRTVARLM